MSRYRKIEVRTWGDEKFRALSPIPPCAQGLWFYLLTGPHTGPIPGLFRAGRAAMAEDLNWDPKAFGEAFQELIRKGIAKADFDARLVWIPNAIKHNRPAAPNVVKSWPTEFVQLPECDLKVEAFSLLKAFVLDMGEGFAKAFAEAFPEACRKPYGKPSRKTLPIQEQEQEQDINLANKGADLDVGDHHSPPHAHAHTHEAAGWDDDAPFGRSNGGRA